MLRVLVADDEPIERLVVSKKIQTYFEGRLEVVIAENGSDAVEQFFREGCSIAILDINMPGMDGLTAAEKIREKDGVCSIVFLTAYDEFSFAKKAFAVRALDYLLKPGSDEELIAVLEEAISLAERAEEAQRARADAGVWNVGGQNADARSTGSGSGAGVRDAGGQNADTQSTGSGSGMGARSAGGQNAGVRSTGVGFGVGARDADAGPAGEEAQPGSPGGQAETGDAGAPEFGDNTRLHAVARTMSAYIHERYQADISLQDAASYLGYSDAYFCKIFKQCFDRNFTAYLTEYRIAKAKELLADFEANIKDVCLQVGFRDSNYFAKVFKRNTGMTPSEYRNSAAGKSVSV